MGSIQFDLEFGWVKQFLLSGSRPTFQASFLSMIHIFQLQEESVKDMI